MSGAGDGGSRDGSERVQAALGYRVAHAGRALAHALRVRIEPLGVVPGQYPALLALYERDGLTQSELCAIAGVEQPTMANTLARMQRDGLVERVPDRRDGRRSRVLLSARARDLRDQLADAARSGNAVATRGLDDRQVAAFLHTLDLMIANLEQDAADGPRDPRRP